MRVIPWISVVTCHISTKSICAVVRFLTDALSPSFLRRSLLQIDVTLCEAQEWNIPWQDPRKSPVGLDLIRALRATDGALLLVPVGASPEGKA